MAKVKEKSIDPKRFYTLGEIVREQLIPGVSSVMIASRLVRNKRIEGVKVPRGFAGVQYKVQGKAIINFLVILDDEKGN